MMTFSRCHLLFCVAVILPSAGKAANEAELKRLWDQHINSPEEHDAVIESCRRFVVLDAEDPLIPVVHGIEAWHLFKSHKVSGAEQILQPYLTAKSSLINTGATAVAKGWMTRLDREPVTIALQLYYRKEVGYPASLADLVAHPKIPKERHPPLTDRFGNPWHYQLIGIKGLPDFQNQRYELQSTALGEQSDFATALKAPYGFGIDVVPEQVWPALNPPQVTFKNPAGDGGVMAIPLGKSVGGLYLAYIGSEILIVCNHSYWKIFPRP